MAILRAIFVSRLRRPGATELALESETRLVWRRADKHTPRHKEPADDALKGGIGPVNVLSGGMGNGISFSTQDRSGCASQRGDDTKDSANNDLARRSFDMVARFQSNRHA